MACWLRWRDQPSEVTHNGENRKGVSECPLRGSQGYVREFHITPWTVSIMKEFSIGKKKMNTFASRMVTGYLLYAQLEGVRGQRSG